MIADATFLSEHQRRRFFLLAQRLGVALGIVDCAADVDALHTRISSRMQSGLDVSEADFRVLSVQMATQQPLNAEERAHVIPAGVSPVMPHIRRIQGNGSLLMGVGNQVL